MRFKTLGEKTIGKNNIDAERMGAAIGNYEKLDATGRSAPTLH